MKDGACLSWGWSAQQQASAGSWLTSHFVSPWFT